MTYHEKLTWLQFELKGARRDLANAKRNCQEALLRIDMLVDAIAKLQTDELARRMEEGS
jgi:hypothetical protein